MGQRTSRDNEASGPSELHIRDFLESNQRARQSNFNQHDRSNLAEINISRIYSRDYQEATPQHFDPRSKFDQQREYGNYFAPPPSIINRYEHDPRRNPYRGQNPAYNLYDPNNGPYPHNLTSRSYRAGADSPNVYEISDLTHKYINKSHLQDLKPYISTNREF